MVHTHTTYVRRIDEKSKREKQPDSTTQANNKSVYTTYFYFQL